MAAPSEDAGVALVDCRCDRHGGYRAYLTPGVVPLISDCPRCIDEPLARREEERRAKATQHTRRHKLRELVAVAGIPARFADRSFADYHATLPGQRMALTLCQAYADSWPAQLAKGGSLVLTGGPGTGKTHLACAVANVIMPAHMASAAFGTVSSMIRGVRSTYGKLSQKTEAQALAELLLPDLLIVDEVGASTGTAHESQLLFDIINQRYENLRPMILISNLNAEDLLIHLGHRAMDRFAECGSVVAFDWESHRGKKVGA